MKSNLPRAGWLCALLLTLAAAVPGGFHMSVDLPDAAVRAKAPDAVLAVRPLGCHEPAKAKVSASAEGIVNGKRESRPLRLQIVSEGVYALSRQWPSEGVWVLAVSGTYLGRSTGTLVELGPGGAVVERIEKGRKDIPATVKASRLSRGDINAALATVARRDALGG
jgi:hypothetical protein